MSTPAKKLFFILGLAILATTILYSDLFSQEAKINPLWAKIDQLSAEVESKCISWRRDIHQNPELGNREFRTSKLVAEHLKSLGLEVKTGIAHTGVVGILRGKKYAGGRSSCGYGCLTGDRSCGRTLCFEGQSPI